jgi:hypothetical protein
MSEKPSIKGSIVAGHAEVMQKYVAAAQIDEKSLASYFDERERTVLAEPINATGWYDIDLYRRLLEFLRDYPGEGRNDYLIAAGCRSAENLIRAGIHQQFEYLRRTQHHEFSDPHERSQAFGRDLRLLNTISASILNFGVSTIEPDPEHELRWIIVKTESADYPEALCWTTQGFINRMAEEHGTPDLWYWERLSPDTIHFRMNRDI